MSIPVVCTKCSAKLNAPDSAAGKRVKCPKCQTAMLVPEAIPEAPEFEVVDDAPPAKKPPAKVKAVVEVDDDEPRPKRRPRDDDDDDDDDRPRKKKRKAAAGENSMMTRNIIGGVVLVVLLGVVGYVYYDRFAGKKDGDPASSSNSDGGVVNPRIVSDPAGGPLPKLRPSGGGGNPAGKPADVPGGNPGKKAIGTPGQPTTLTSKDGFKITFPGPYASDNLPPRVREKIGVPVTFYISEDGSRQVFGIAYLSFPPGSSPAEKKKVYETVVSTLLEDAPKGGVPTRRPVTAGGRNWEEITIMDRSEGGILRLLQTESHMFVLLVHNEKAVPSDETAKKFFDSFELK
jgi:DNA-directed RNA polymerase subunit RPC12/RpoP